MLQQASFSSQDLDSHPSGVRWPSLIHPAGVGPHEQAVVRIPNVGLVRYGSVGNVAFQQRSTAERPIAIAAMVITLLIGLFAIHLLEKTSGRLDQIQMQVTEGTNQGEASVDALKSIKEETRQIARSNAETLKRFNLLTRHLNETVSNIDRTLSARPRPSISGNLRDGVNETLSDGNARTATTYILDPSIPLLQNAVVHYDRDRDPDFWLVEREVVKNVRKLVRVVPFGRSDLGVMVHSLDDGHNFMVSVSGAWISCD